jgi:hypothetical protein
MKKISSHIWRVSTEKLGSLQAFRSERDMESFLMNNPSIIVGWDSESSDKFPLKEQQFARDDGENRGRIDIVGIAKYDGEYSIRIFELKNEPISPAAVAQIRGYRETWKADRGPKNEIRRWILDMNLQDLKENELDDILENPMFVLIGSAFSEDAVVEAQKYEINGVRLARFQGEHKSDYYIIIEDQIGDTIKRRSWSWQGLINKKLMSSEDYFYFKHKDVLLRAQPDPARLDWNHIYLKFDDPSKKFLLENEEKIKSKITNDSKNPIEKGLRNLHEGKSVVLTNATALAFYVSDYNLGFWTPKPFWGHEKSGKTIEDMTNILWED